MLAAGVSRDDAAQFLDEVPLDSANVACVNSPTSVTLSGDAESISKLEKLISGAGKFARKLKVTTAYHSSHMKAVAQGYLNKMGSVDTNPKSKNTGEQAVLMFSSLTGEFVNPEQLGAEYWVSNMCSPVEFSAAVTSLLSHVPQEPGVKRRSSPIRWDGLIEIGPHTALKGPVQQIITAAKNKAAKEAPYMAMILRGVDAIESSLSVAGNLWGIGHPIHLDAVHSGTERSSGFPLKCLSNLPTYPWNHARTFWHEAYSTKSNRQPKHARTDLLGAPEDMQNSFEPRWNNYLRISENPWIEDHQITGTILYPAAGMLVMALEGALRLSDKSRVLHGFRFNNVNFERGLVVPSDEEGAVKTTLSLLPAKEVPDQYRFTIFSTTVSASWTKHCHGTVALEYKQDAQSEIQSVGDDAEWSVLTQQYQRYTSTSTAEVVDVEDFYDHLQSIGMEYGPLFRNVVSLHALPSNKASHGIVIVPDTKQSMPEGFEFPHVMHPATMDAIFHLLLAAFNDGCPVDEAAVPYSIEDMFVAADQPQEVGSRFRGYGELVSKNNDGHEIVGDLTMSDELWSNPKLIVKGFALRQVTASNDSTVDNALLSTEKCASIKWSEDDRFSRTLQSATETGQDLSNTEDATFGLPSDVYLLVSSAPSAQITSLCSLLGDYYASSNVSLHRVTLSEIVSDNLIGKHVVSLMEVESALIYSWTEEEFAAFKSIISTVDHLLWITRGGLLDSFSAGAEFAPAQGLLRVLRNEYTLTTLPHLDLSLTFDYTNPDHCQRIFDVWKASLEKDAEMEYAESNGNIYVPRVVGEQALDEELQLSSGSPLPIQSRLGDSEIPLKLTIASRASKCLGTAFDFRDCLQSNEVEIQIEYVALDKSEASTSITASQGWGKEAAGTITQCGSQVNGFHVGQRVAVLGKELSKTKIRVDKNTVVAIPSALASQDAVTMVIASITAQYSLLEIASISERSTVLVNSAGSALGQAAIQICQAAGATTFALVVSKEEKDLLVDKYGISPTNIFDSSLRSFVAGIRMVTYGLGVDAVFNPEYNSATGLSTGLLNNFGYFLDLHARSASSTPTRLLSSTPNAVIVRIDMDSVIEARPKTIQALLQTIFSRSKHGQALTTIAPVKVFTAGQLPAAVEALRALQNGKIVLAMDSTAEILTMPPPASKLSLRSDATYVLAGGLGVLGLEIANLMAESGAKHLVFLTRSGGSNKEKDLEAFRARGVRAEAYKCDITDSRGVARIFQQLQAEGYVVKGVVQCAMVLEVCLHHSRLLPVKLTIPGHYL
jgi:acyl transferase domain-containing protein